MAVRTHACRVWSLANPRTPRQALFSRGFYRKSGWIGSRASITRKESGADRLKVCFGDPGPQVRLRSPRIFGGDCKRLLERSGSTMPPHLNGPGSLVNPGLSLSIRLSEHVRLDVSLGTYLHLGTSCWGRKFGLEVFADVSLIVRRLLWSE